MMQNQAVVLDTLFKWSVSRLVVNWFLKPVFWTEDRPVSQKTKTCPAESCISLALTAVFFFDRISRCDSLFPFCR